MDRGVLAVRAFALREAAVVRLHRETRTRAALQSCILGDANFLWILRQACVGEDVRVAGLARGCLVACCAQDRLLSVHALFSLALQQFSLQLRALRTGRRVLEGLAQLALSFGDAAVVLDLVLLEPRCLLHVLPKIGLSPEHRGLHDLLLGDVARVFDASLLRSECYRSARHHLLDLVAGSGTPYALQLVASYCKLNGFQPDVAELSLLVPFVRASAGAGAEASTVCEWVFELLCDCFCSFGCGEEELMTVVTGLADAEWWPRSSSFALGIVLLLKRVSVVDLLPCLRVVARHFPELAVTVAVCSVDSYGLDAEEQALIKEFLMGQSSAGSGPAGEVFSSVAVTCFGHLVRLAAESLDDPGVSSALDGMHVLNQRLVLVRLLYADVGADELGRYLERGGDFENLFVMLVYLHQTGVWTVTRVHQTVAELIGMEVEGEPVEVKQLRLKWLIEYLLAHAENADLAVLVPVLAARARENAVFAFIQQIMPRVELLPDGHFTFAASVALLLRVSETRQTRLQYLVVNCMSFLTRILTGKIELVSPHALVLIFSLLARLSALAVIDPRQIWLKVADAFMAQSCAIFGVALATFVPAFNAVQDKDGVDEVKARAVTWLIDLFYTTTDELAFTVASDSLAILHASVIEQVEYQRLTANLPVLDEEGSRIEYGRETVLAESILFSPPKLWALGAQFSAEPLKFESFRNLWASLIRREVSSMPRSVFIGSNDAKHQAKAKAASAGFELSKPPSSNSPFLAGLLLRTKQPMFAGVGEFVGSVLKPLISFIPSLAQISWMVRPFTGEFCLDYMRWCLLGTDDAQTLRSLADVDALMAAADSIMTAPQSCINVCLGVSALVCVLFERHAISEKHVNDGWLQRLTDMLAAHAKFRSLAGNEEFLAAVLISIKMFDSHVAHSAALSSLIASVLANSGLREASVAAMTALEVSSVEFLQGYARNGANGSKRRLCALIQLARLGGSVQGVDGMLPERTKDGTLQLGFALWNPELVKDIGSEPLEFKGLLSILSARAQNQEHLVAARERAFSPAPIPATLKFEAIVASLADLNFDPIRWQYLGRDFDAFARQLAKILDTTNDARCVGLVQSVLLTKVKVADGGTEEQAKNVRFGALSHFYWIASKTPLLPEAVCVLNQCPVLPRFDWSFPGASDGVFPFLLLHTISVTPGSKTLFVSESLRRTMVASLGSDGPVGTSALDEANLNRLVEIMFYIFDENQLVEPLRRVCESDPRLLLTVCNVEPRIRALLHLSPGLRIKILDMLLDIVADHPGSITSNLLSGLTGFELESLHFAFAIIKKVQSREDLASVIAFIHRQGPSTWPKSLTVLQAIITAHGKARLQEHLVGLLEIGYIYEHDVQFMREYVKLVSVVLSGGTVSMNALGVSMAHQAECQKLASDLVRSLSAATYLDASLLAIVKNAQARADFVHQAI